MFQTERVYMDNELCAAKEILKRQVETRKIEQVTLGEYKKVYRETNENIDGYMNLIDFQGKEHALTVLSSGDHVFNLLYHGILNIDTFDTNPLTEYYALGLKRSAILALNYKEYLKFMKKLVSSSTSIDELYLLITSLFPYMCEKYRYFWQTILDYNYHLQKRMRKPLNLFQMLLINIQKEQTSIMKNSYLQSEENYNKTKTNLAASSITFQKTNCLHLSEVATRKYDLLFLSNILDYLDEYFGYLWGYKKLKEYSQQLSKIMNKKGCIALTYTARCYQMKTGSYISYPILSSRIKLSDLTTEELLLFPHIEEGKISKTAQDGLILRKI